MTTGNKGEWSEVYALFKLLSDGRLSPGDANLEKIGSLFYPIIEILRNENSKEFCFKHHKNVIHILIDDRKKYEIPIVDFNKFSKTLLDKIKNSKGSTFSIKEVEYFMNSYKSTSLKASSSQKTDISIKIHDSRINQEVKLGFSIKSQLGSPSTLLNAGKTTNFIYELKNIHLTDKEIDDINKIKSFNEKIQLIRQRGIIEFYDLESNMFKNNLVLIDSNLHNILAQVLLFYYSNSSNKLVDILSLMNTSNPLKFDLSQNHDFYSYKIKRFLTDTALGMMPSKVWSGKYDSTGGYLVIRQDGEIVCYHMYNKNEFEDYLLNNTKLDTASTSRHGFGYIYKENNKLFFKLNLQIRFLK